MSDLGLIDTVAARLARAEWDRRPVPPVAAELGEMNLAGAYAVQAALTREAIASGRRVVGRKIGLTAHAVQLQLGVDQPDYGTLFADMAAPHDGVISSDDLIQPRVEAEIALVLGRDLPFPDATSAELVSAVDHVAAALEVVDSRIADWRIGIVDTIADNGSSARFVLGLSPRRLTDIDLETCGMVMTRNGAAVSFGSGAACLGHPLKAALWLVRTMAAAGAPLRAGDIVLTGALGPMADARPGDRFEARIGGFAPVCVGFGG